MKKEQDRDIVSFFILLNFFIKLSLVIFPTSGLYKP